MNKSIDPVTWYSERKLEFTPPHFIVAKHPLTAESKLWIVNNLRGRYSITTLVNYETVQSPWLNLVDPFSEVPAFEDPKEAVMYELTWT